MHTDTYRNLIYTGKNLFLLQEQSKSASRTRTHLHTRTSTYTHGYAQTRMHTYTRTHTIHTHTPSIHTHTQTHIHTRTHTRTRHEDGRPHGRVAELREDEDESPQRLQHGFPDAQAPHDPQRRSVRRRAQLRVRQLRGERRAAGRVRFCTCGWTCSIYTCGLAEMADFAQSPTQGAKFRGLASRAHQTRPMDRFCTSGRIVKHV